MFMWKLKIKPPYVAFCNIGVTQLFKTGVVLQLNSIFWESDVSSPLAKGWNIIPTPNPKYLLDEISCHFLWWDRFSKLYMESLKIYEKWARLLLSCTSLKLSLMPNAESNFLQHVRKSEKNITKWKGGQTSKKQHYV